MEGYKASLRWRVRVHDKQINKTIHWLHQTIQQGGKLQDFYKPVWLAKPQYFTTQLPTKQEREQVNKLQNSSPLKDDTFKKTLVPMWRS